MAEKSTPRKKQKEKKTKSPHCKQCDRAIRIPKGWSMGAGIRRHYWSKHREMMMRPWKK